MLSAIVYGRNDGYSYELNRRTALGLNQLARQLEPGRDEIVFVDYNTDDDLPTHPEAISDTLTDRAIELIRVIRIRPSTHAAADPAGPPVREAFCRNVALRRLSPSTEWVLSTNPDCLLIAEEGAPLSQLITGLPEGYFGLPRFEAPRFVWEALPRSDAARAAEELLSLIEALHLKETVRHYLPSVGYDAPGDFQLARASDLRELCGFDESMTQGWHVDSNMNARLALRYGALTDLNAASGGALMLFHAEHARRFSPKHSAGRDEDPFEDYVVKVVDEAPKSQKANWGRPDETYESFPLSDPPARQVLARLTSAGLTGTPDNYVYGPDSFDTLPRSEGHLAAFLADHLAYAPPCARLGWFGETQEGADWFQALIKTIGLPNPVSISVTKAEAAAVAKEADILILDAPPNAGRGGAPITEHAFAEIIPAERRRADVGLAPRRIIGLNVPHSRFEAPFLSVVPSVMTPVATHIRYGQVAPRDPGSIDLSDLFAPGDAADGGEGYATLCRRPLLIPDVWRVDYQLDVGLSWKGRVVIDIALDGTAVADTIIPTGAPGRRIGSLTFTSGANGLFGGGFECRIWTDGKTRVRLVSARLTAIGEAKGEQAPH